MDEAIESLKERIGYNPIRAMLMRLYLGTLREMIQKEPDKAIASIDKTIARLDQLEG